MSSATGSRDLSVVDDKPIPGLYAAGEVTGGFHGKTYMSATAFIKGLVFGYVAANTVVQASKGKA